ncbi:phosphoribosyltransferase [Venenivibrio stagnispumantis]|uniref:ribose-phosphate diphosphokinase n=1 Tax=Venenivibrio stagnispumantis TaxID=407998 RepID=A0AA46ADC6_9AQUI|nr:phosphoribosyltransferase family protein [Venenivibrio stagnispumantis]MCW4572930.1 phosphoribosyltransferase family protein [Venenivibrio stagnispumantis]SMP04712.1 Predicted phosphoribosyltransferase [Venenivibrio stagnispumantis]
MKIYKDRKEAAKILAEELSKLNLDKENTVIVAIPRGAVIIAYEIAKILKIPFTFVITKKLAPLYEPEAAFGAIALDKTTVINERLKDYMNVSDKELEIIKEKAFNEVKERFNKYLNGKEPDVKGKTVIVVDDGIATGYTAIVAARYLKNKGANKVILAVGVCPYDSLFRLKEEFDLVICPLIEDTPFFAVGAYYEDFQQVEDDELFSIVKKTKEENLFYE